jgi:hypothetical protein
MYLFYYDEYTPSDYQPKYFKDCQLTTSAFEKHATTLKIGETYTPNFGVKLRYETDYQTDSPKDRESLERLNKKAFGNTSEISSITRETEELSFVDNVMNKPKKKCRECFFPGTLKI